MAGTQSILNIVAVCVWGGGIILLSVSVLVVVGGGGNLVFTFFKMDFGVGVWGLPGYYAPFIIL